MKEFHYGLCVTTIIDIRIDAESAEAADEVFRAAAGSKEVMEGLPKTIIDKQYEVLGMNEGPLQPSIPDPVSNVVH